MNKWIYIKSDRIIDAYAVASVLNDVPDTEFFLVRKTRFAKLFKNHPHISMSGFYENSEDSQLIIIKEWRIVIHGQCIIQTYQKYWIFP